LTKDEARAELARIRPDAADALNDAVPGHAARCRQDPRELLNEAVHRALSTRAIPVDIPFDTVLAEIARSIASSINISRHRAGQHVVARPIDEIVDLLPAGGYAVMAPDEIIEQERIRDLCIDALARIAQDNPKIEALLDGIGQGLRGEELMRAVGISKGELATIHKALKRSVKRIRPEVEKRIER
jgi:hypothetical protein